jgi:glutaredoxin
MRLTLYTRPDCHLCNDMKDTVLRVLRQHVFELIEVDISRNHMLERQYGRDIPILFIDGTEADRHRIDEMELLRKLTSG